MSKSFFMTLALAACMLTANAQPGGDNNHGKHGGHHRPHFTPEQRADRQADRISRELMLDDATAEKFKAIYKDYKNELAEINKRYMPEPPKREGEVKPGEKRERKHMTDVEVENRTKDRFAHQRAILDVEEKYYDKFRTVLNPRQVDKVYRMSAHRGKPGGKGGKFGNGRHPGGRHGGFGPGNGPGQRHGHGPGHIPGNDHGPHNAPTQTPDATTGATPQNK